jgi:hypothetical protein
MQKPGKTVRLTDLLSQIKSKSAKTLSDATEGPENSQNDDNLTDTEVLSQLEGNIIHLLV